ncbi:MAG: hypothetical protein JSV09_06275 [Thermoplasmata archaeon]|nr:MAG: hypothetical protein JSV09_06275 [Thermoplasmata archaeon]
MKRNKQMIGNEIAETKAITTATVSKSLKEAKDRIANLLKNTARSNKVKLDLISPKLGYARGYSPTLKLRVYITYSPINGIQVWYDHQGECAMCEELNGCKQALFQEFKEREIEIPSKTMPPTDLSAFLFTQIEGRLT